MTPTPILSSSLFNQIVAFDLVALFLSSATVSIIWYVAEKAFPTD
jgi:hypothetical protein